MAWVFKPIEERYLPEVPGFRARENEGKVPKWKAKQCPVGNCSNDIWRKHKCFSFYSQDDCILRVSSHLQESGSDGHYLTREEADEIASRTVVELYWISKEERECYLDIKDYKRKSDDDTGEPKRSKKSRQPEMTPLVHVKQEQPESRAAIGARPKVLHDRGPSAPSIIELRGRRSLPSVAGSSDDQLLMNRAQVMAIADDLSRAASACNSAEKVCRAAMEGFRREADTLIDARDDIISLVNRYSS